jgi:hypothetical protein
MSRRGAATRYLESPNKALQATCETHAPERRRWAGKKTDDERLLL